MRRVELDPPRLTIVHELPSESHKIGCTCIGHTHRCGLSSKTVSVVSGECPNYRLLESGLERDWRERSGLKAVVAGVMVAVDGWRMAVTKVGWVRPGYCAVKVLEGGRNDWCSSRKRRVVCSMIATVA